MHSHSFLLSLTGSEQSRYAAQFCLDIAEKTGAGILAQHVIDREMLLELLRHDDSGLIGNAEYQHSYDAIYEILRSLGSNLLESFKTQAQTRGIAVTSVLDTGNPIAKICQRAQTKNLVIIGHRLPAANDDRPYSNYISYAIARGLVWECPNPLMVIQHSSRARVTMKVLVRLDNSYIPLIDACARMAALLGMPCEILCITDQSLDKKARPTFEAALHELAIAPMPVHMVGEIVASHKLAILDAAGGDEIDLDPGSTLLVIPTRGIGADRTTAAGVPPDTFIQHLMPPNVLLWPEGHLPSLEVAKERKSWTL